MQIVLLNRPDILNLGDLVTSQSHIGRLKKQLESDPHDEWFVTKIISTLHGRPVGVRAIVHCSLACHLTDCVIQRLETSRLGISQQEWTKPEVIDGRKQCLKVTLPGSSYTWKFVAVYQHVARSTNRKARSLMRSTVNELVTTA